MKLSKEDADLYYKLMRSLQLFVNKKLNLFPEIKTLEDFFEAPNEQKLKLNQSIYDNSNLIDVFTKENPDNFSGDELEIVSKWKNFVQDEFYLERILKKHGIFISTSQKVYGVLGLYDGFDDLVHSSQLPFLVKAVLLPFKGKIIYDGLLQSYNLYFGKGIKTSLKENYMKAKQNGRIIETFEEVEKQGRTVIPVKSVQNWKPELDEIAQIARKLRGGSQQPPLYSPVFSLIKASAELGQAAVTEHVDFDDLWEKYEKAARALKNIGTTLERFED